MARNSLQVTINGKEFVSKEAKKAETSLTGLQKVGEKVNTLLKASFVAAAAGIVATTAAIAKGIKDTTALADNIDKMSQKIGISREAFQEWDFILSQNGMNIESLQTSVKTLVGAAEEASRGTETYARTFRALGLSVTDTSGSLKDQERLLFETIKALSEVENTTQRTALATDLFGRSATELAPLLNSGADSIEELRDKARSLGLVLGDETVDAGVRLTDTVDQLRRTFQAVVAKAVTPFLGVLDDMGQRLAEQVASGGGLYKFIQGLINSMVWIVNTMPKVGAVVKFALDVVGITAEFAGEKLSQMWDTFKVFLDNIGALDAIDNVINFAIEVGGNWYDALKKGFDTGDWSGLFGTTADILNAGIMVAVGLSLVKAFGLSIGAGFTAIAGVISSKLGLLTSGISIGGAGAIVGGISIAVGLIEAAGTGNWAEFKTNISTAIYTGLLAAGLGYSGGAWVVAVSMSLGLGKFLEGWTEENLTDELAQEIVDAIKEWWNRAVRLPLKYFWDDIGKDVWDGIVRGVKTFAKTIDIVGAVVDLVRNAFAKDEEINKIGQESGVNLVNGMAKGVESKQGFLGKTFDTLVDLWHTAWDEHSPSRVAIETGQNVLIGFEQGISDPGYRARIQAAWDAMVGSLKADPAISLGGSAADILNPPDSGGGTSDSGGGGIPALLSGFGDLVGAMDSFKAIMDPLSAILSGVMDVLGPAIDTILQPIINILRILGQTLGSILLPVFTALGFVVQKLAEGFVWFYNAVIKPVGNFIMDAFTAIGNGLIRFMNGIIWLINLIPGVNIGKIATMDPQSMHLQDISLANVSAGAVGSTYAGSAPGSSTSVQSLTVNISQYFQGNVIGDGGMEAIGEFTVKALQAYQGSGGNVQVVGV